VVSNAGYGLFGAAEMLTDAQIEQQLATNLTGSIQLIRAVLPYLRDQGGGRIVQISSEGGQTAYPGFSLYHAGKWGIEGFIEAVAQEVAPFGIDFMIAEPGPTQTGFGAGLVQAESMGCYQATAVGDVQQALAAGNFGRWNDPYRSIDALIEATDRPDAPFRLAFGSTAYHHIQSALTRRLDTLRQHQAVSLATDSPPDSQT
jgi:NAD(P)-dependent dehydrogenase (short-subunit alcohol dehydrogenase family)